MASTLTIYSSADSYVDSAAADTNYGSEVEISTAAAQTGYMKFSLSSLPSGAVISAAVLYVYFDHSHGIAVDTYNAAADWVESTITYNNAPGSTGAKILDITAAAGWVSNDITNTVKAWKTGANYGLVLKQTAGGSFQWIASKETGTPANKPYLLVTYSIPARFGIGNPWIF
jgi:hypothetical protein